MKCPSCQNEVARLYPDGCQTCHDINRQIDRGTDRLEQMRASLARVEGNPPKSNQPVVPAPVKKKEPPPMSKTQQIRWTPEERQQVAVEVDRLFHGLPFAAKAVKQAQECLPADRRKSSIGPVDLNKIRALIPGAKSPRPARAGAKALATVPRRAPAGPKAAPLQLADDALPSADSFSDVVAQQLVGAVIGVGVQALEKAASRLRSVIG